MSDLIDRQTVLGLVSRFLPASALYDQLEQLPAARVSVVANISGGVLQGASASHKGVDVYCLDFEDTDPSPNVVEIDGSEAYLMQDGALHEPDFVRSVIEAESPYDA